MGALSAVVAIGVATPDVSEYAAINPAWGIGDPEEQIQSAIEGHRALGRLPVNGHDVGVTFAAYAANDAAGKVEAARRLAELEPAAVLGGRDFSDGALWLATRRRIPIIDVNALPSDVVSGAGPWLFTLRTAQDILYRAAVRWADAEGWLTGRKIGVFSDYLTVRSAASACDELRCLGHHVHTWIRSDGAGVGSDADEPAADTFIADGVDVVFPFVGGSSWIATMRHASGRGYHPRIVELETGEHTNDVTARMMPPDLYDGTKAVTMSRAGEAPGGFPLGAETERCLEAFDKATGRRLDPSRPASSGELSNVLLSWDLVRLLVEGLRLAGTSCTTAGLIGGLDRIANLEMASGGDVTFGPRAHWGIRQVRTIEWQATTGTWVATSAFRPVGR